MYCLKVICKCQINLLSLHSVNDLIFSTVKANVSIL